MSRRYTPSPFDRISAQVQLLLHLEDKSVFLAQTGSTEIKLRGDVDVPNGPAVLETLVNGESFRSVVEIVGRGTHSQWLRYENRSLEITLEE